MNNLNHELPELRYRYENYLREAEHERLVRLARQNQPGAATVSVRLLLWLGHHMSAWGALLEKRFKSERVNSNNLPNNPIQSSNGC